MGIISRTLSIFVRAAQLISAVVVAGIIGHYIHEADEANLGPGARLIYTEVVAGLAILMALLLFLPLMATFSLYFFDFILFILWIVSFGLLVDFIGPMNCSWGWNGYYYYYNDGETADRCSTWKAALAFIFISAILWLISGLLGIWIVYGNIRDRNVRRGW